ncbi:MAG: hypothetical protein V8T90_05120 [Victivallales bacterium]
MKINWKKLVVIQIEKPPKVKSIAELFQGNVKLALSFVAILILLMQVPWILYVLEPLWVSKTAAIQIVSIGMPPLCIFSGSAFTMILVAVSQDYFFSALAKERKETRSCWNECAIDVPILRYWILYRLLAESDRIPALVMIGSSMMFWGIAAIVGPLSPLVLLSFSVSVSTWLVIAKRLSNGVVKHSQWTWGIVLLSLFAVSILAGYITFYWTEMEIKAETLMLQSAGIPTNREELEQHFYQGRTPNAEFGKLVDRNADSNIKHGSDCLESASGYYKLPESKRKEIKAYLTDKLCREDFKNIDALIESGESLKYEMRLPDDYLTGTLMPHLNYYLIVIRYFSSRIIVVLEKKNPAEAMRLFRLTDKFQENVLQSDFLIGARIAIACEHIRNDAIGAMLGSGLLSDANLSELLELNRNREEKIQSAIRYGLCTEAYSIIDTAILLNVPYPKMISEIRWDGQWQYEGPLLRFLFRGNTTVFPTPPCLWTEAIQQRYWLYAMRHQRAVVRYFNDPTSQREILRADLKRELATRELYFERMLLPDYFRIEQRLQRALTISRMTDLGLQIEQFRRKHGHLPETLDELDVKLPVDALSGEPIRYTKGKVKLWEWESGNNYKFRELPGWQLSAPGGNYQSSAQYQHESKRDTFTVITQWPIPAAPEPPKIEFPGFWRDAPKAEEAKP